LPASVPSSAFFEERLEVATEESTQAQKANRLAQEEAAINKLAEEGSKYTTFGEGDVKSPKADGEEQGKDSAGFPFTSPEAKARVDAIIARREKERTEPSRDAPKPPPAEVEVTPPPPPSEP